MRMCLNQENKEIYLVKYHHFVVNTTHQNTCTISAGKGMAHPDTLPCVSLSNCLPLEYIILAHSLSLLTPKVAGELRSATRLFDIFPLKGTNTSCFLYKWPLGSLGFTLYRGSNVGLFCKSQLSVLTLSLRRKRILCVYSRKILKIFPPFASFLYCTFFLSSFSWTFSSARLVELLLNQTQGLDTPPWKKPSSRESCTGPEFAQWRATYHRTNLAC